MRAKKIVLGVVLLMAVASIAIAAGKASVIYATNPVGTGFYTTSAGQGSALTKYTNLNMVVQPTSGPEGVVQALKSGQAQIGLMEPFLMKLFWKDMEDFKRARSVQAGNILRFSFVTHEKTGIKSVADLKGRKVSFTGLSASHKLMAEAVLKAYGIDPEKDVMPMKMSFATMGFDDLSEGRTDAVMASIAGGKLEELGSKVKVVVLPIPEDKAMEAGKIAPLLIPALTPSGNPSVRQGIPVVGLLAVIFTTSGVAEDTIYTITKTLVEKHQELTPISEELSEWVPDAAVTSNAKIPYHPGAIKYYKERKLWSDKMEKWQEDKIKEFGGK